MLSLLLTDGGEGAEEETDCWKEVRGVGSEGAALRAEEEERGSGL